MPRVRARAALEHDGLLIKFIDPGGQLGTMGTLYGLLPGPGWLLVDQTRLDDVESILDELGIVSTLGSRPIVDRAEPSCPSCHHALDPQGPESCPACGAAFTWVSIDAVEGDETDMT